MTKTKGLNAKAVGRRTAHTVRKVGVRTKHYAKRTHTVIAQKPHTHLLNRWKWYRSWHSWQWKKLHHSHIHYAVLGVYILAIGFVLFSGARNVFAADQTDTWDFSTPADYTLQDGLEINGNSVQLEAQEYSSDGSTAALYPLNESSGSSADDASSNNNTLNLQNSPRTI